MKKTFLFFLLTEITCVLHASPVSPEKAMKVAEKVFASQPATKAMAGELKIVWDGEFEPTKAGNHPDFYVVGGDGDGFVIVAGDDNIRPVLGFSFENPFRVKDMPCNVEALMRAIKRYCQKCRQSSVSAHAQWERFVATKAYLDPNLISNEFLESRTVCWNQTDPANLLCPVATGQSKRSVCGCTSLSFAQVMTWFGFPERGEGVVEEYTYETDYNKTPGVRYTHTMPAHELGTVYNWAGLQSLKTPSQFYAEKDTELGFNLAQLTYDIGTILQASYNDHGTWCGVRFMNDRLCVMMHYNKGARELLVLDYPFDLWVDMLKDEVSQHPVITSGWGHSYLADGYATFNQEDLVFHYNIGWGGSCNGYYYAGIQDVDDDPKEDYRSVNAIFGFYPDPDGSSKPYSLIRMTYYEDKQWGWSTHAGIRLHPESNAIGPGEWLLFEGNGFYNSGTVPLYGDLGVFRINAAGKRDSAPMGSFDALSPEDPLYPGYVAGWTWWMQAPSTLSFGDRFAWYFKANDGDYEQVVSSRTGSFLDELPVFPAAMISKEKSYSIGDYFYFRLVNNDYTYSDAIWHVTWPDGKVVQYPQSDLAFKLNEQGTYTLKCMISQETLVTTITVK